MHEWLTTRSDQNWIWYKDKLVSGNGYRLYFISEKVIDQVYTEASAI